MDFSTVKANLEKRGFTVSCFDSAEKAANYLDSKIDNKTVGFGGSVTLEQMELYEKLKVHNDVRWHHRIPENKTDAEVRLESVFDCGQEQIGKRLRGCIVPCKKYRRSIERKTFE